ncbi:BURP domain protein RD22 [Bienertia sinuspersici]
MEFRFNLLPIFAFVFVTLLVKSHAASSTEEYWKKVLPNTPIPKSIEESLKSDGGTGVHVGGQGVDVGVGKPRKGSTDVHVGKGGTSVHTGPKGKHPKGSPFVYQYAATKTQLQDNQTIALFFQQKDLKPGTQMNLHFTKTTNDAPLLPRKIVKSVPFSSEKLPEILNRFDVDPNSDKANTMSETIKECESKGIQGEEKFCTTSLESMVDYATSKLGKNVDAISTYVGKNKNMQKYVFTRVNKVSSSNKAMVCHKLNYAYALFYCHKTMTTKTYMVNLEGNDGTKVKAAVICHMDTSKWNPKHLAFQVLKVEPGKVPVCHFLPEDHIVWVPKY